ncbi:MAG: D-alanine--D-alanine ligase family protein [Patescibacteria group bacterium]|jgi:D-alanine-D-alanine ligase
MKKIKVAILYGGISAEHEVSCDSAKSVIGNLDKNKFTIIPVEISKKGRFSLQKILSADVVFPCLHGVGGEDGSIQGFCEVLQKPYVGSGIEASALALDKIASKQIFQNFKLPVPSFKFFNYFQWQKNPSRIMQEIKLPVFVKPANTGSSIGITKVKKKFELKKAIEEAFKYDSRVIIEEVLENIREIEVSILGNEDLTISMPGEIIPKEEFYNYNAKYKSGLMELVVPAEISKIKIQEIQGLAKMAYRALGCCGMARVDCFLDKNSGKIYLNEINTIPGFTKTSVYPKLMEESGICYKDLLTKLITLALGKK